LLKSEFEGRLGYEIAQEDWERIEYTYMLYPCVNGNDEKQAYVLMFKSFGMRIFEDMGKRVREIDFINLKIKEYEKRLDELGV